MKKSILIVAIMALMMPMTLFAQGAQEKSQSVRVLSSVTGGKDEAENALFEQQLEKALGFDISWEKVPSGYDQVLMQKLGAGEKYDLVYLGQNQMYSLASQGAIMDLTSRIKASKVYAENVDPQELKKIAFNDKYYAGFNKLEVYPLPNVNKAITDTLDIDLKSMKTLDDYHAMLVAVKKYMETTGNRKPYYPMFTYMKDIWDLQPFFSSVGARRGVFLDAQGKKYAPYVENEAAPVWQWLTNLYAEGLIDPSSFTGKTSDMRSKMWQSQDIVLDSDWAAWTGLYNNNAKTAGTYPDTVNVVPLPGTLSPEGTYLLEQGGASLWAIPTNAENPDKAFKLIEYFATKEGGLLLSAGIEGHDYVLNNGKLEFTEIGIKHAKDHGAPFPISKNFDASLLGPMNPGVAEAIAYASRPDVKVAPMGNANGTLDASAFYTTVSKWMTDCMMGKMSVSDAMEGARNELRAKGIID